MHRLSAVALACIGCASSCGVVPAGKETKSKAGTDVSLLDGTSITVREVRTVELIPEGRNGFTYVLAAPIATDHPIPIKLTSSEGECEITLAGVTQIGPGRGGARGAEYLVASGAPCKLRANATYESRWGRIKVGNDPERVKPAGP